MPKANLCSSCSKPILASAEGRMPPWCPHCGATIKSQPETASDRATSDRPVADRPDAERPATASPGPLGRAGFVPTVDAAPTESFFHACIPGHSENDHKLYRVYITPGDLLVFAIGVGQVSMGEVLPRTRSLMTPLQTGMVGAIARREESHELQLAERIRELDAADEATLRQFAVSGDRAFVVAPADVKWMTLDGPSIWNRWVCSVQHEAMWKFAHRTQGRWSLALPSYRDARRASEWLPRIFGDAVKVSLSWGSAGRRG